MYIASTGLVCSVGLTAESACAAMRAGIANFQETPYLDNQGEPIIGAMVPGLEPDLKRGERLGEMLALAVADCLKDKVTEPPEQIPMLLGLAEPERPGGGAAMAGAIITRMVGKLGVKFHPQLSRVIAKGHTSGFEGLRIARELFKDSEVSSCLVCGVDSYVNASSLLWLDRHQRLKTVENSDGVIPGEAGTAVLLRLQFLNDPAPGVKILGTGFAREQASILNEQPMVGLGLTKAARAALAQSGLQPHEIEIRLSDVTGESYGFKEQALTLSRLLRSRREELPIWHCADSIGEIGAAAGICQLIIANRSIRNCYSPGNRAICYTSAECGDRAVTILQASNQ